MDKPTSPNPSGAANAAAAGKTVSPAAKSPTNSSPTATKVPRLFRSIDWLTFLVTFVIVMGAYYYTLAPNLTLEDSGELATGSFYAGIPHPPGYPVWTLYTWAWTLLPISNVAWRVALGSAFAGAVASGLLGLLVSRGSSMMIEGIADLKSIDRRWENAICVVSGLVAGLLLGFNGYMWSQSVIVEVYSLSVVSLMGVLLCLMRWIYAPQQRRYIYWACFLFGICFTNHQSLIVAAIGIVVAFAAADRKMGRASFVWIIAVYIVGVLLKGQGLMFRDTNAMIYIIFNVVGLGAIGAYCWTLATTDISADEIFRDALLAVGSILFANGFAQMFLAKLSTPGVKLGFTLGLAALAGFFYFAWQTRRRGSEWLVCLIAGILFCVGAAFYFYMPLAGMSTPPMQWGYPRTWEGFVHAFTRGQYEKTNPTDLMSVDGWLKFGTQLKMLFEGIVDEFNWVYALLAIIPFIFFLRMQKRERAWVIGVTFIYLCLGPLLLLLINPPPDRQARELIRVFFTASHVMVAMGVGYGLTLIAAEISTRYEQVRGVLVLGAIAAFDLALFSLVTNAHTLLADFAAMENAQTYGIYKLCCWLLAIIAAVAVRALSLEDRLVRIGVPAVFITGSFGVTFAAILQDRTSLAGFGHMATALSRAFQPDQYAMPLFAGLILLTMTVVLLVVFITQRQKSPLWLALVLFAMMPIHTFMSHWSDNEQRNHLFGYWFGHDMFTPPFKGQDGKPLYPEMTRDAILYGGTDPGRFCPTYMIFCESFIPPSCKQDTDPKYDRRDVYIITQNALADGTYLNYIRSHYNRSAQIDPPFFQAFLDPQSITESAYTTNTLGRLAARYLDGPITRLGKRIEDRRRREGVYPPKEMYIASPEDSQRCFQEYLADAQRRLETKQLKPGEDVRVEGGRVQVSGQIAVMAINGLITKVMFDRNPTNEFFVEESFPLDWMYPHLTPFGIIMKINREKQTTLTEDVLNRDHQFWTQYSDRLIGNWITYDTPVSNIVQFVEKVYLQRNFSGFKGDHKFVRDDQAQKAFSKLRSSIGGVYAWRLSPACPPEFKPKTPEEFERIRREADFTFRQAFAFCPYSPEAVFRYVQLLLQFNRVSDALLVARTCLKLDPYNGQVIGLVQNLEDFENRTGAASQFEGEYRKNPANFQNSLNLAAAYFQAGRTPEGMGVLDSILNHPKADAPAILAVASAYAQLQNSAKLELTLEKLVKVKPESAEAWYDLAALRATLGKNSEAITALTKSLSLKAQDNLAEKARTDTRFVALRAVPEFQKLIGPK